MSGVTITPSWVETTLRWIEENHPEYVSHARGAGPLAKLTNSLVKMSYRLAECGGDRKRERLEVEGLVSAWDFDDHNDLRGWLAKGGYAAVPSVVASMPPVVFQTPDGPEAIELVMPVEEKPAPAPAPAVQTLDDVLADADERYGAW